MANITVRKQDAGAPAPRAEWEPARWMRDLVRWDPFREIMPAWPGVEALPFSPAFEVKETGDGYVFTADLPGVADKDVEITRTGDRLTMPGKRETEHEEQGERFYTRERTFGRFTRSFTLPDGVDLEHIRAELKSGVLTVVVPKTSEARPRKIAIKTEARH